MTKKGLKEFLKIYDIAGEVGWLALDLAQNLAFRFEVAKDKNVQEEDVHMAYGLAGMGKKYPLNIMLAIHDLAKALGYTRKDYIDNQRERCKTGNINIYIAGQGSLNCNVQDLLPEAKDD